MKIARVVYDGELTQEQVDEWAKVSSLSFWPQLRPAVTLETGWVYPVHSARTYRDWSQSFPHQAQYYLETKDFNRFLLIATDMLKCKCKSTQGHYLEITNRSEARLV